MDRMYIRDLALDCIVGVPPRERLARQRVVVNIVLECDLSGAGASDALEDTVDYAAVAESVTCAVQASTCRLIERLAQVVAETCLGFRGVAGVTVTVDKPGALPGARAAAVEIRRRASLRRGPL